MKPSLRIYFHSEKEIEDIKEVSELLGAKTSTLLREIVIESLPRLKELGQALKKAKGDPVAAERFLNMVARSAQTDLLDQLDQLSEQNNDRSKKKNRAR